MDVECRHDNSMASTLKTWYVSPLSDITERPYWFVQCSACGKRTDWTLIQHEALKRGCAEWWAEK